MNISNNQNEIISFMELPPEDLTHIASFLPIKGVKQLRATCFEMQLITKVFINADIQGTLETLISYKPKLSSYLEKAKSLPNHSDERIQISRDAICSLIHVQVKFEPELNRASENSTHFSMYLHREYKLAAQMTKVLRSASVIESHYSYDEHNKEFICCLDLLIDREINPKNFTINFVKKRKYDMRLDEKILNLTLKALQKIESVDLLRLHANMWYSLDLEKILKVVKLNEKVKIVEIKEGNTFSDFGIFHQRELTKIISNQLVTSLTLNHNLTKWNWDRDQ